MPPKVRHHEAYSHGCYILPFVPHRPPSLHKFKEERSCGSCGLLFLGGNSEDEGRWDKFCPSLLHLICGLHLYFPSPSYSIHSEFLTSLVITLVGLDGPPSGMTQIFIPEGLEPRLSCRLGLLHVSFHSCTGVTEHQEAPLRISRFHMDSSLPSL